VRTLAISLSVILLPIGLCAAGGFSAEERILGTYYFYWYDWNSSLHIYVQGKDSLTHHPPEIESVSYLSSSWHRRELLDMMEARIDFVLPVYWGDSYALPWSAPGLERFVQAEIDLIREGATPPKIGMFYDTTSLMLEHQYRGMPGEKPDLTTDYGRELFYKMIRDFYTRVPQALRAEIDGAALVWLYSSAWVRGYDQALVEYTKERFKAEFGSEVLIVRERSWEIETGMEFSWGAALGPRIMDVAAIGPGFDNEGAVRCYGQQPLVRDRLGGYAYRDDWEEALRSGCKIVVIETWNELHEGTEICETVELGREYIEMTAEYALAFKENSWNRTLKEIDSELVISPRSLGGAAGEIAGLNVTVTNRGWRSWPEHLDLSFFFLGVDSPERTSRAVRLEFPHRLSTGESYSDIVDVGLPGSDGRYRVLVSTSYLGERPELTATVPEACIVSVLILLSLYSSKS
jgi:hypothetical protein